MTSIRDAIKSKLKALGDRSDSKDELDEKKETVVAEMKSLVRAKSLCCFFLVFFVKYHNKLSLTVSFRWPLKMIAKLAKFGRTLVAVVLQRTLTK